MSDLPAGNGRESPNHEALAREHARKPLPKRFYSEATTGRNKSGLHVVLLDGRPVRTPARNELALPTEAAARLVMAEFAAQSERIDPAAMPVTRLVNSAIDGVSARRDEVVCDILRFAGTDLVCYRAEGPDRLCLQQGEAWDPVLRWAGETHGVHFMLAAGVMHVEQPPASLEALAGVLERHASPFAIAAIHSMTTLMGSALLAIAVAEGAISADSAWRAAHVDEDWNIAQWGEDSEASSRRRSRENEMQAAAMLLASIRTPGTAL